MLSMETDARTLMCEQLKAVGFADVAMLSKPCQPSDAVEARSARGRGLSGAGPPACVMTSQTLW